MLILGIDPGSQIAGYGLIKKNGNRHVHIENGICATKGKIFSNKLVTLFEFFTALIDTYKPDAVAIENIFVYKNVKSTQKLGEARGVLLLTAGLKNVPIFEYTPMEVKKAITGYGAADKDQVGLMIRRLLNLKDLPDHNACDALALALCHAQSYHPLLTKLKESTL